jgi:hypothetical protein
VFGVDRCAALGTSRKLLFGLARHRRLLSFAARRI